MTKPKNPAPASLKDGDEPRGTWPGAVPGSGEAPIQEPARDPRPVTDAPVDPAVSGDVPDPNQLASAGPEGAPQPKPREEDPGINANVVS